MTHVPQRLLVISILIQNIAFVAGTIRAEVPILSSEEMTSDATDIVAGTVRAVYSSVNKSDQWIDTASVAEIEVMHVAKGSGISVGDVIYAHYWNKNWIGDGVPDPHSQGHAGVSTGEVVKAYLSRKDGTYHVLLPNGFQPMQSNDLEDTSRDIAAALQGTWKFVYYEEKGATETPGSKQFVIDKDNLAFRAGGQTRVETTIKLDTNPRPRHFTQSFRDGQVYRSIYTLAGDYLILCGTRDGDRPARFSSGSDGGGEFLIVLKKD